jgi:hypothetical protein
MGTACVCASSGLILLEHDCTELILQGHQLPIKVRATLLIVAFFCAHAC